MKLPYWRITSLADHVALQNRLGVDSETLDGEEIARRWPALAGQVITGAGFRQADGWANQHRIVDGLVRGALAAGVDLRVGTEALAIETSEGNACGVATTNGHIAANAVVVATGPWTERLLAPFGRVVPVVGRRHELLIVEPAQPLSAGLPWLIGVGDEAHLRPDVEGRALVGGFLGHDIAVDSDTYDTRAEIGWPQRVLETAGRVFGVVDAHATVHHGWAGSIQAHPITIRYSTTLRLASMGRLAFRVRGSCTVLPPDCWSLKRSSMAAQFDRG